MHATIEKLCFLLDGAKMLYVEQSLAFHSDGGYSPDSKDMSMEDEVSPSVGSITGQRLVETVTD
jgi:hypothetical protein